MGIIDRAERMRTGLVRVFRKPRIRVKYQRLDASLDHLPRLHLLFVENTADRWPPAHNFCDVVARRPH
jgi:hypothetical protein